MPVFNRHIPAYSGTVSFRPDLQPMVYPPHSVPPNFSFFCIFNSLVPLRGFTRVYPTLRGWRAILTRINPHNKSGKVAYFSKRPQAAHHNLWCTPVIRAHIPAVTPSACRQRHQERLFVALFPGCSTSCTLFRMSFVTLDSGLWTLDHFRACAIVRLRPTTELSSTAASCQTSYCGAKRILRVPKRKYRDGETGAKRLRRWSRSDIAPTAGNPSLSMAVRAEIANLISSVGWPFIPKFQPSLPFHDGSGVPCV